MSPMACCASADRVHDELLANPARPLVQAVAARWGFFHFGRFAEQYRRKFGDASLQRPPAPVVGAPDPQRFSHAASSPPSPAATPFNDEWRLLCPLRSSTKS